MTDPVITEKSTDTKGLLTTVHNCVYFASKVLEAQINLLEHLDRPTLAYLVENPRLESFCPQVKSKVHSILGTIHILRMHLYNTNLNLITKFFIKTGFFRQNKRVYFSTLHFDEIKKKKSQKIRENIVVD